MLNKMLVFPFGAYDLAEDVNSYRSGDYTRQKVA